MFEIFQKVKSSSPRSSRTIFQMIPPIGTHLCPQWIPGEVQEGPPPHFFETPCSLITVVLIGRLLEAAAKQRTTDSLDELVRASPPTARVNGEELPIELVPWPTWCHVVLSLVASNYPNCWPFGDGNFQWLNIRIHKSWVTFRGGYQSNQPKALIWTGFMKGEMCFEFARKIEEVYHPAQTLERHVDPNRSLNDQQTCFLQSPDVMGKCNQYKIIQHNLSNTMSLNNPKPSNFIQPTLFQPSSKTK